MNSFLKFAFVFSHALIALNAFADGTADCQQAIDVGYKHVPMVIVPVTHKVSVELLSGMWTQDYGLIVSMDGQAYMKFEAWAPNELPVLFSQTGMGWSTIVRNLSQTIQAASIQGLPLKINPAVLRAAGPQARVCAVAGESLGDLIAFASVPAPEPNPAPAPAPAPTPSPISTTEAGDRSAPLPEGQTVKGMTLQPQGDRS